MAKRQQLSFALSTATPSLKFENRVGFDFPVLYLSNIFTVVRARTSTSHGILVFVFSGSCSQPTSMRYHVIRNVVLVVFWGTLLRRLQELKC